MNKIFILMFCLGCFISKGYANQAQSQNPFDKKVYLPGDFFEYIFEGRGPVPKISYEYTFDSAYLEGSDNRESIIFNRKNKFYYLMLERLNYCIQNQNDEDFLRKHAAHCKIVAHNLAGLGESLLAAEPFSRPKMINHKKMFKMKEKSYKIKK